MNEHGPLPTPVTRGTLPPETMELLHGHAVSFGDRRHAGLAQVGKRPLYRYLVLLNGDTIGHVTAVQVFERVPVRRGASWTIASMPVLRWLPVDAGGASLDEAVKLTRLLAAQTLAGHALRGRTDPTKTDPSF